MKALYLPQNVVVELPGVCNAGVPALVLLREKAPQMRVEVKFGRQGTLVPLERLDLTHRTLSRLNAPSREPGERPSYTTRQLKADSSGEFPRLDIDANGSHVE